MADVTTHHITTDITPVTPNSNLNHEAGVGDSSIGGQQVSRDRHLTDDAS